MKRRLLSILFFLCIFSAIFSFSCSAEESKKLSRKVTYNGDGTAVLRLEASSDDNYITYTTDSSKPTKDSRVYTQKLYILYKITLRAAEWTPEGEYVRGIKFTVSPRSINESQKIKYKSTYMPNGNTRISITKGSNANTVYYTTNGLPPTKKSKQYTKALSFSKPTTLRLVEYNSKGNPVRYLRINVKLKCQDIEYKCIDIGRTTFTIKLESKTPGVEIYYTLDGKIPTEEDGILYTNPIVTTGGQWIRAVAFKDGYVKSSIFYDLAGWARFDQSLLNTDDPRLQEVADIVNRYRADVGMPALIYDEEITKAANIRAREIYYNFANTRPTGKKSISVLGEVDITGLRTAGEYIYTYIQSPEDLVAAIASDKAGQDMITDKYYTHIGVGYYEVSGARYWVILFAWIDDKS